MNCLSRWGWWPGWRKCAHQVDGGTPVLRVVPASPQYRRRRARPIYGNRVSSKAVRCLFEPSEMTAGAACCRDGLEAPRQRPPPAPHRPDHLAEAAHKSVWCRTVPAPTAGRTPISSTSSRAVEAVLHLRGRSRSRSSPFIAKSAVEWTLPPAWCESRQRPTYIVIHMASRPSGPWRSRAPSRAPMPVQGVLDTLGSGGARSA